MAEGIELTLSSTDAIVDALLRLGDLRIFLPRLLPNEAEQRRIVMLPALWNWVHTNTQKPDLVVYYANIRAHLGRFVKGETIDNEDFMKELSRREKGSIEGKGVWEFRVTFQPQRRIFGAFVAPDLFFATHWKDRGELGSNREKWRQAITRVEDEWARLFPGRRWLIGSRFSDYVTFKGDDRRVGRD